MELANNNIEVVVLSYSGRFVCRLQNKISGNISLRKQQILMSENQDFRLSFSKIIIKAKTKGQMKLIKRHIDNYKNTFDNNTLNKLDTTYNTLELSLVNISNAYNIESLLGIEGNNARMYFSTFNILIRNRIFKSNGRNKHPNKDEINCMLSYLYTILNTEITNALNIVGLDHQCGFMHTDRSGRDSLAWDIQEELRVFLVDRLVIKMLNKNQIKQSDFEYTYISDETTIKEVLLNNSGKRRVLENWNEQRNNFIEHKHFSSKSSTVALLPIYQSLLLARAIKSNNANEYKPFTDWK